MKKLIGLLLISLSVLSICWTVSNIHGIGYITTGLGGMVFVLLFIFGLKFLSEGL